MDVRRRRSPETADERLDRLIEMEKKAGEQPAHAPGMKRLKVVESSAAASAGGHRSETVALDGQTADGPQLALQLVQEAPAPEGLLAPLFEDLGNAESRVVQMHRMDAGDSSQSTAFGGRDHGLQMEPYHGADQGQGSGHHGGLNGLREAGGVYGHHVEQGATVRLRCPLEPMLFGALM